MLSPKDSTGQNVYAIYIRVSTEKQVEHGDSIEMQQNVGEKLIKEAGGVLYKVYIEPAVSATKTRLKDRTVLLECMRDAKLGLFNKLIAYRRDRLARKTEDSLAIRNMLQEANCDLVFSASGEMQAMLNDPYGKLMENIRSSLDEIESAQISIRVSDVMRDKATRGEDTGGNLPYGYRRENGNVVPIESELIIIKEIEDLYLAGFGVFTIAKWLNGEKIRNLGVRGSGWANKIPQHKRSSEKWTRDVVSTILFNPFYAGIREYSKEGQRKLLKNKDSMIIRATAEHKPSRTVERHQQIMNLKKSKLENNAPPRFYTTSFLLTGLLYCKECGQKYISRNSTRTNGKQYSYYTCSSRTTHIGQHYCTGKTYKKELLESFVLEQVKIYLDKVDISQMTNKIIEGLSESKINTANAEIETERSIDRLSKDYKAFSRLILELSTDDINYELLKKEYQREQIEVLQKLNEEKIKLERIKTEIRNNETSEYSFTDIMNKIKNFSNVIDNSPIYAQKILIDDIIETISIDGDGELSINFKLNLISTSEETKEKEVEFDVINYGGVGDTTTAKRITVRMDTGCEYNVNFFMWAINIYLKAKQSYGDWLNIITKSNKLTVRFLSDTTGLSGSTCKGYLKNNTFPIRRNAQIIVERLNVNFNLFLRYINTNLNEEIFYDLIDQVERWKRNGEFVDKFFATAR